MDYGQTKYSQVLPGTTYYLGLHRPTISGLYSGKIWLEDEIQKWNTGTINRHLEIHEKTVEEQTFFLRFAHMFN